MVLEYMDNIMVSICCTSYNHERYIGDAIESFLMQKTNFDYEILIHDDASTDNTAKIIKDYESRYPDKIRVIYQTENQQSKGIKISAQYVFPNARGKYIALCEGDDYWINPHKLQIQVDYMENNPDCSLTFHSANMVTVDKEIIKVIDPYSVDRRCGVEDVLCKKINYPTASLMFPTQLVQSMPAYYHKSPVGDVPLQLHLTSQGYGFYFRRVFSAYRTGVPGSWSSRQADGNSNEKMLKNSESMIKMYRQFDEFTNHRHSKAVLEACERQEFEALLKIGEFKRLKQQKYEKFVHELSRTKRTAIYISRHIPAFYGVLRRIKKGL